MSRWPQRIIRRPKPVRSHQTVVVVGGGATGAGIARDAALRGFQVIVVERSELASGTTGHFHGILHSGARYAVLDPATAAECYAENQILRQIAPSAITDTGGLFLAMNAAEATYADGLMAACTAAGIPVAEISVAAVLKQEPHIASTLKRAFTVPDAFVAGLSLVKLNQQSALRAAIPATFLTRHSVISMQRQGDAIRSVQVRDEQNGTVTDIACDYVINAAGVWAGAVTDMAKVKLAMVYDKGTMMAYEGKYSSAVLNRCRAQDDGDLLVPTTPLNDGGEVYSVLGTTARVIPSLDDCQPTQEEVDKLLREGAEMVPSLRTAHVIQIYAGIRPLQNPQKSQNILSDRQAPSGLLVQNNTRGISRSFHVIDHSSDGVSNFISVVGGKVTIYRLMAEKTVDLLCQKSGRDVVCATAGSLMPAA